jgi:hypothetical protein
MLRIAEFGIVHCDEEILGAAVTTADLSALPSSETYFW